MSQVTSIRSLSLMLMLLAMSGSAIAGSFQMSIPFGTILTNTQLVATINGSYGSTPASVTDITHEVDGDRIDVAIMTNEGGFAVGGSTQDLYTIGILKAGDYVLSLYVTECSFDTCAAKKYWGSVKLKVNDATTADVNQALQDDKVLMSLAFPRNGETAQGINPVQGWAIAKNGIDYVEMYVDDVFFSRIPFGGRRADVEAAFPDYPYAFTSGFSMAYSFKQLSEGPHKITIIAYDTNGKLNQKEVTINIEKFGNQFIQSNTVDANSINVSTENNTTIAIKNYLINGKAYDIKLDWENTIQGLKIISVEDAPE